MTAQQRWAITDVRNKIQDIMNILDNVMYGGEELSESEFGKIRAAYDLVCKANDKL